MASQPQIRYTQTATGTGIAYATYGDGPVMIYMPEPFNHLEVSWESPAHRYWYEGLAARHTLVRYDPAGQGLSDPSTDDYGLEAAEAELEAVIRAVDRSPLILFGGALTAAIASSYAAKHPDDVSALVLWDPWTGPQSEETLQMWHAVAAFIPFGGDHFSEAMAAMAFAWQGDESQRAFARLVRAAGDPASFLMALEMAGSLNLESILPDVQAPTLVLFRRGWGDGAAQRTATQIASRIPDAVLTGVSGVAGPHWAETPDETLQAIDAFLDGIGAVAPPPPETTPTPGMLQAILFTDVEESTLLTATLGDDAAREVMRTHEQLTREAVVAHGGTEVKAMGDGFMVAFPSASGGLDCAVALQQTFADHNESADTPIRIRIGVNAGEPIAEDDDLFGTAVIVAARVAARANGGEILTTEGVRHLVAGKGYGFSDRGTAELKGFEELMRLYAVAWE